MQTNPWGLPAKVGTKLRSQESRLGFGVKARIRLSCPNGDSDANVCLCVCVCVEGDYVYLAGSLAEGGWLFCKEEVCYSRDSCWYLAEEEEQRKGRKEERDGKRHDRVYREYLQL